MSATILFDDILKNRQRTALENVLLFKFLFLCRRTPVRRDGNDR